MMGWCDKGVIKAGFRKYPLVIREKKKVITDSLSGELRSFALVVFLDQCRIYLEFYIKLYIQHRKITV